MQEQADTDAQALATLVHGWSEVDSTGEGLTAATLAKLVIDQPCPCQPVADALRELCEGVWMLATLAID